ncbi:MAG: NAD+ synthase [Candidatus Omnitrophica bacterium]|nr:NAD+ synthase [Candidatus Omnitrophota bacterium]
MKKIRIALAQGNTTVGDFEENAKEILGFIETAKQMDSDIVVFPELSITGYPPEDLLLKKHFVDDNIKALHRVASRIKNITAVVGFVNCGRDKKLYNAAAVISGGAIKGIYSKECLLNYGVFDEKRHFSKGEKNSIFSLNGVLFGVSICEDIWEEKGPCVQQVKKGAQILLNLSASPYCRGKTIQRQSLLVKRAKQMKSFVCYCNLVGGQDELVFDGASVVISPKGEILATGRPFEEDLIVVDVEVKEKKRASSVSVCAFKQSVSEEKVFVKPKKNKKLSANEEIYNALVCGTRDYIIKNGFKKIVLGVSGGIDSALVAVVASDAIGKENVWGVSMPSQYTSKETKKDAQRLAKNLGINFMEIPIGPVYQSYIQALRNQFIGQKENIAEENLQARIRGNILMALSNKFGHLVLATGNKSEISVGYCTLYGDMAGGFAPIKDVLKTKVYELVDYRNHKEGFDLIPQSIILRAPTAELKKGQKDQDSLPPYDILDAFLESYVEGDHGLKLLKRKKGDVALGKKIIKLVDQMEYKRRQAPLGVRITPKAFGRDRRLPVVNKYVEK